MEEGKKSELEEFPGFHLLMCDKKTYCKTKCLPSDIGHSKFKTNYWYWGMLQICKFDLVLYNVDGDNTL